MGESQMAVWTRILITVGALLALASEVDAGEFGSPYSSGTNVEQHKKASDGFTPSQVARNQSKPTQVAHDQSKTTPGNAYKIGPSDVIDISVFQVADLSKTVQVDDSGNIVLPLLGEVPAAGKTADELQEDLRFKLGAKYLQDPQVTVIVKESNNRRYTISGEINAPGVYPLKSQLTLLQVVAMAGGFKDNSDSTVLILRNSGGKRYAATFDVDAIQKGQAKDPVVRSGDSLVAGTSAIKKGYQNLMKVLPLAGFAALL
jgi:polysaccharide export outer membrane protein